MVEEDGIRNSQGDGRAPDLRKRDEPDRHGNLLRLDLDLRDGESGLRVHAATDAEQDRVAVDLGGRGVEVDSVHERAPNEGQDAAGQVPRHVIPVLGHHGAVQRDSKDQEANERQKADTCFDGGVVAGELEVERDEVDGHEEDGDRGGHLHEEDDERLVEEELAGEDASVLGGEDAVGLLQAEDDPEDARDDEAGDCLAGVPGVDGASEIGCHNAGHGGSDHEDCAEIVQLGETLLVWDARSWVVRWKHEEVDRGADGANEDCKRSKLMHGEMQDTNHSRLM